MRGWNFGCAAWSQIFGPRVQGPKEGKDTFDHLSRILYELIIKRNVVNKKKRDYYTCFAENANFKNNIIILIPWDVSSSTDPTP